MNELLTKYFPGIAIGIGASFIFTQINKINKLDRKIDDLKARTAQAFSEMANAVDGDIQSMADEFNTELHEVYVTIADKRYGEED